MWKCELINFEMEVNNIFMIGSYDVDDSEKVLMTMKWLGHKGLHSIQTLSEEQKEKCKSEIGLFSKLIEKFRLKHTETILSLQYCKISRKENESA